MFITRILLLCVFVLALSSTLVERATAQEPRCTLSLPQAPKLRGLSLGMTQAQVLARFPGAKIKDFYNPHKRQGVTQLHIQFVEGNDENKGKYQSSELDKSKFPDFNDVQSLSVEFLDKRSYHITLIYDDTIVWENTEEFVARVSEALNLPGAWHNEDDWPNSKALVCTNFRLEARVGHKPWPAATLSLIDTVARQTIAHRFDNRRRTFKP